MLYIKVWKAGASALAIRDDELSMQNDDNALSDVARDMGMFGKSCMESPGTATHTCFT